MQTAQRNLADQIQNTVEAYGDAIVDVAETLVFKTRPHPRSSGEIWRTVLGLPHVPRPRHG